MGSIILIATGFVLAYLTINWVVCMISSGRAPLRIHREIEDKKGENVLLHCVFAHVNYSFPPWRPGWLVLTKQALRFRSYPYLWPFLWPLSLDVPISTVTRVSATAAQQVIVVHTESSGEFRFKVTPRQFTVPASILTSSKAFPAESGTARNWMEQINWLMTSTRGGNA